MMIAKDRISVARGELQALERVVSAATDVSWDPDSGPVTLDRLKRALLELRRIRHDHTTHPTAYALITGSSEVSEP